PLHPHPPPPPPLILRQPPTPTLFPYTTLFRSHFECNLPFPCAGVVRNGFSSSVAQDPEPPIAPSRQKRRHRNRGKRFWRLGAMRSEEHTSELQSRGHLVCRLLLEKKKSHQLEA